MAQPPELGVSNRLVFGALAMEDGQGIGYVCTVHQSLLQAGGEF
jgi:hypothetical protein